MHIFDIRDDGELTFVINHGDEILFDIAVTVSDETEGKVGGEIKIASIGIGSNLETKSIQSSISRIKFSVKSNWNHNG